MKTIVNYNELLEMDIYSDDRYDDFTDFDEISGAEEGFMIGYISA
jgi:hypothetical protein